MKKGYIVFATIIIVLLITGCSSSDMKASFLEKSGIMLDEDYQEYQSLAEAGELNGFGEYIYESDQESNEVDPSAPEGSVHVTFAENRNLHINYYQDTFKNLIIDVNSCYLNPGDSIYAWQEVGLTGLYPASNLYNLTGYRIVQIYEDGSRMIIAENNVAENGLVLEIPTGFEGTELSVVPIGSYSKPEIQSTEPAEEEQTTAEEPETTAEETKSDDGSIWDFFTDLFN